MDKKGARKISLELLKKRATEKNYFDSKKINTALENLINSTKFKAKNILFYLPMAHEANIIGALKNLRKKYEIYAPFMGDISFKMVKFRLPLGAEKYKIRQPKVTKRNLREIDIIIVPLLAIDKDFKRVGFGKGMYDRFYEALKKEPIKIFVQTVPVYFDKKLTFSHDIAGDFLVTSRGIFKKSGRYDNRTSSNRRTKLGNDMVFNQKLPYKKIRLFSSKLKSKSKSN